MTIASSRRGGPGVPGWLGIAVAVGLVLYGLHSYNGVKSSLRLTEEKADRLKIQRESMAAQLQAVYEYKEHLQRSVQDEKTEHKKTKDNFVKEKGALEEKLRLEKKSFNEELIRTRMEHSNLMGALKEELNRIKLELSSLKDSYRKVEYEKQLSQVNLKHFQEQSQRELGILKQWSKQQRQECDSDIAQLNDKIADLSRQNAELEIKLHNMSSSRVDIVNATGVGHNLSLNEEKYLLQIAEPGDSKQMAYFEVKSPAPDGQQLVNASQLPLAPSDQVVPPVLESQAGVPGADVSRIPDALDGPLRDNLFNRNYGGSFENNLTDNTQRSPEGVKEERNSFPALVPTPAQNASEFINNSVINTIRPDSPTDVIGDRNFAPILVLTPAQNASELINNNVINPIQPDPQAGVIEDRNFPPILVSTPTQNESEFVNDVIYPMQQGLPEGIREERNSFPVLGQDEFDAAFNQLSGLDALEPYDLPNQVPQPEEGFRQGHAEEARDAWNSVGDDPGANTADEEAAYKQTHSKERPNDLYSEQNPENEQNKILKSIEVSV